MLDFTSGCASTSWSGRNWHASRNPSGAWMRASASASISPGAGSCPAFACTRTRQVVQRPRPPQIEVCGRCASRLTSRIDMPTGAATAAPSG